MELTQQTPVEEILLTKEPKETTKMNLYEKYSYYVNTYYSEISSAVFYNYIGVRKTFGNITLEMFHRYVVPDALFALQKVVKEKEKENLYIQSELLKLVLEKRIIKDINIRNNPRI